MITVEQVEQLFRWGPGRQVLTKHGDRILRTAPVTESLQAVYYDNRKVFSDLGISLNEYQGKKEFCWWTEVPVAMIQAIAASRATDADIDIPCPANCSYDGYQKAGIAFALASFKKYGGCIIGDSMGLGKTVQAIGVLNSEPKIQRALFIVPNSLKLNWYRELKKWLVRQMTIGIADPDHFPKTDIVIANFDILHKYEKSLSFYWDLVTIDEAHKIKNPKSMRAKAILGYRPTREEAKEGMQPSSGIPTRRKLALTGTPIENRTMEIFPLLNWIDSKKWKSSFDFGLRYCGGQQKIIGRRFDYATGKWVKKYARDFKGASNTDELQSELRSSFFIRRLKEDVLLDLPPKRRQIIILPSDGLERLIAEERKIAERWEPKLQAIREQAKNAQLSNNQAEYAKAVQAMEATECASHRDGLKASHDVALAKVPLASEHIGDALEEGGKIILFGHHLDVIAAYMKAFKEFRPVRIIGEDKVHDRQRSVDTFQTDPNCRLIVCGIMAAGTGWTLTASSHVIFAEIDYVPGVMSQCEDRSHRRGQMNPVLVQHLVLAGSVDVSKVQTIVRKQEVIDQALDNKTRLEQNKVSALPPTVKPAPTLVQPAVQRPAERPMLAKAVGTDPAKVEQLSFL